MAKKLKKNGFIDGTLVSYISIVFTKILGMLYIIPFTALIGTGGKYIYSCVYIIYNLVLNASTSGIPTATSILIADYNTRELHKTKMKIYRVGNAVSLSMGILFFLILEIFANQIAEFYTTTITTQTTVSISEFASAIRCIGVCLLVVPFLSVYRGFLQGHKILTVSAFSQVVEQIVRIGVVLLGAYFVVRQLHLSSTLAVDVALLGAGVGALAAIIYLKIKTRNSDDVIVKTSDESEVLSTKHIIKMFVFYCIPILIVAVSANIYELVDQVLVIYTLTKLNFGNAATEIGSIISTYGPKIAMIISALAMGMTSSIVPEMSAFAAKHDYKQANHKLCSALNIIFAIALPIATGIVILSDSVYSLFYGNDSIEYGSFILKFIIPVNVVSCIKITLCMAMQGLKKTKAVCFATITGIIANLILDIPLMLLLYYMGMTKHCYVGAMIATVIGQSSCIFIILGVLKKSLGFSYNSVFKPFIKVLYPTAIMGVVIYILNYILPITTTRSFIQIIHLCIYAGIGAIIYFVIIYLNGAVDEVFGDGVVSKILRKLKLKKRS